MVTTLLDVDAPEDHGDIHDIQISHEIPSEKHSIAYAITITSCATEEEETFQIAEGAAVLAHSIKRVHTHSPYGYHMYAIYHPKAEKCAHLLQPMNYTLISRDTPVAVEDIEGDFLRERIVKNGT